MDNSDGAFSVRVLWDCTDPVECVRTLTVTNNLPTNLTQLSFLLSFNFDVTPTPKHEDMNLWSSDYSGSNGLTLIPEPTISPLMMDSRGAIQPLDYTFITDPTCYDTSNQAYDWLDATSYTDLCDAGATVQFYAATLLPGTSFDVTTRLRLFDNKTAFAAYVAPPATDPLVFYVASTGWGNFDSTVVGAFVEVWGQPYDTVQDPSVFPGDCPCQNNGVCSPNVIKLPCVCDDHSWGDYCENTCGIHGIYNATSQMCVCEEGWWGTTYCNACPPCLRGSVCDPVTGNCWCRNKLSGPACDKPLACPKPSSTE